MEQKMLVVYYSFSNGNTRRIARQIQEAMGAEIAEIETVVPYPPYGGYGSAVVSQGKREVDQGFQPEIRPFTHKLEEYDIIAIGTPTWWYTMAPAMLTFLKSQKWEGKKVIPFMTHGGWPGHVISDIKKCCPGADFVSSMEIQFDSEGGSKMLTPQSEITAWIERLGKAEFSEN